MDGWTEKRTRDGEERVKGGDQVTKESCEGNKKCHTKNMMRTTDDKALKKTPTMCRRTCFSILVFSQKITSIWRGKERSSGVDSVDGWIDGQRREEETERREGREGSRENEKRGEGKIRRGKVTKESHDQWLTAVVAV
jgi:hypothetical protein